MTKVLWTATSLLILQAAHSYILLTANIEDVQNVAKRLVQLPISGQVGSIVRRAYDVFDEAYNRLSNSRGSKHFMRTNERDDKDYNDSNNTDDGDSYFRRNRGKDTNSQGTLDEKLSQPKEGSEKERQNAKTDESRGEQNKVRSEPREGRGESSEGHGEPNEKGAKQHEGRSETEKTDYKAGSTRGDDAEFSTLGKSASVYLKKIKKIFENPQ